MSRPRKNFFIRFDELNNPEGLEFKLGGNCYHPEIGHCVITKIHPKRGGVTARKAESTREEWRTKIESGNLTPEESEMVARAALSAFVEAP